MQKFGHEKSMRRYSEFLTFSNFQHSDFVFQFQLLRFQIAFEISSELYGIPVGVGPLDLALPR